MQMYPMTLVYAHPDSGSLDPMIQYKNNNVSYL